MEALQKMIGIKLSGGMSIAQVRDKVEIALLREENKRLTIDNMLLEDALERAQREARHNV